MNRIVLAAALCAALPALADEAAIRKAVEGKLGGAKVEGVQATPVAGIFEVRFRGADGPHIIYADEQGAHIIIGEILDVRTERNLTEERMQRLSAINMDALPYDLAVKVQQGNGRRTLVVFSDPYCPACFEFEKTLSQLDDVTIYYFIYPVIRPERIDQSKAAWCSPDRAKAWLDLARRHKPPAANPNCNAPVDQILALGRKLGIRSTPTLFFADGERVRGGLKLAQLRSQLEEAGGPKPKP